MITKRIHFPIFILLSFILSGLTSCKKETTNSVNSKSKTKYNHYLTLADTHFNNQIYDSAFYYYNKSKLECKPNENEKIIYSLLKMAVTQQIQSDYSGSETNATEAIPYFEEKTNSYYRVAVYNILGINYKNLNDYDNSIYYYNKAYHLAEDDLQKAIIKNNIAVVYMEKNNYLQAQQILSLLSQKKEVLNNPENRARILDNLGYCYYKLKNNKALDYLNQSLQIQIKTKNDFGMTTSYIHFSEYYTTKKSDLAKFYATLAYKKATQVNNIDDRLVSLNQLIKNTKGEQLKKTALLYLELNDSITRSRQKAKNQFAKIKYDSKKDREENLRLKAQRIENALQLEKEENRNLILSLIVVIVTGGLLFLYYYLTIKAKREKSKAVYDTETRISKKIHDELANDVFHTITFAETQALTKDSTKENLLQKLDDIYLRVRGISRENNDIDTGTNYSATVKDLLSTYNNNKTNVIVNNIEKVNWEAIDEIKKITIYRVLQELMVNMKKHSEASLVVIKFDTNPKTVIINYTDNGKGCTKNEIVKNGLQNMENRILAIKGTIIFDSEPDNGFKVKISTPK